MTCPGATPKVHALVRVALAGFVLAVVVSVAGAREAFAHLQFVRSEPVPGAVLARPPDEVRVTFNGTLDARSTGTVVGPGGAIVSGLARIDGADLVIPLSSTAAGTYIVSYTAIDPVDSHPTQGTFDFSVRQPVPTPAPTPTPSPTPPSPSPTPAPGSGVAVPLLVAIAALMAAAGAFALVRARR